MITSGHANLHACVCVCVTSVLWPVVRPSRPLHLLPRLRIPKRRHIGRIGRARRRRMEDPVAGRVLYRTYQSWVAGGSLRAATHLGDKQWASRAETGQCQALFPARTHACRPPTLPRRGTTIAMFCDQFVYNNNNNNKLPPRYQQNAVSLYRCSLFFLDFSSWSVFSLHFRPRSILKGSICYQKVCPSVRPMVHILVSKYFAAPHHRTMSVVSCSREAGVD